MNRNLTTNNCTVLIFSPVQFMQRLTASFRAASEKYTQANKHTQVDVKFASRIEDLVMHSHDCVHADYIAIFVDTGDGNNYSRCERFLQCISAKFVMTRLCLVNGTCRSGLLSDAKELISLGDQFRIPIINAEVNDDESCKLVAEKIIKLCTTVSGVTHGVPVIIPTPPDLEINLNTFTYSRVQPMSPFEDI